MLLFSFHFHQPARPHSNKNEWSGGMWPVRYMLSQQLWCPTFGENGGSGSWVLFLQVWDQVSNIHQHRPQEEKTLLIPGGQRDLQNQTTIFILQGHICNTMRGLKYVKFVLLCHASCAEVIKSSWHFIFFYNPAGVIVKAPDRGQPCGIQQFIIMWL